MSRAEPPYLRIVAELRGRISAGELRPGDRVPSTRQIAHDYGVAIVTATKVLTTLREEGLVAAVPRVGTVVATPDRPARGGGGRRRTGDAAESEVTRERIVAAAIEIADAEGIGVLSMRRIATDLGMATMSLYHYVPGKDELLALMTDTAFGEDELPESVPGRPDAELESIARAQWVVYRRHPWLAQVISFTRPVLAPNGMRYTEWTLRALDGLGLSPGTMMQTAISLSSFVRGVAVNLEWEAQAEQDTGVTSDEWMTEQDPQFAALVTAERFPLMAQLAEEADFEVELDAMFEFGLQRFLRGLIAFLPAPPQTVTD